MDHTKDAQSLLSFLHAAEGLKRELRHSWLSDGRAESVAEHVWRSTLIALLIRPYLSTQIDANRVVDMLVVHDLVEIYAGDVPAFLEGEALKRKSIAEAEAIRRLVASLPTIVGENVRSLWDDFEAATTEEACVAQAIDKLEAQLQHNEADLATWLPVEHQRVLTFCGGMPTPSILSSLITAIRTEATNKLVDGGIDVANLAHGTGPHSSGPPRSE